MSDEITAAIETSIEGLSDAGSADAPADAAPADGAGAADSPAADTPASPAAEAQPAQTQLIAKQPDAEKPPRRGPIPHERHEAAVKAARDQGRADAEAAAKAANDQLTQELTTLRQRAEILDFADRYPDKFLAALVSTDPRYAEAVKQHLGSNGNGHAQPSTAPDGDMPTPDAQFPDGSTGYSPQGLKRLLDWQAAQVEARITKRYEAIEQDHLADKQVRGAIERVSSQVEQAMQWPGFAENREDIAKALQNDRRLTLDGAYRAVVLPKLTKTKDQLRADLIAEMNAKPKNVSGTQPAGGVPPIASSSDDLEAVIKASIAHLPR